MFFDATTGDIVFEWGGLRDQLHIKYKNDEQIVLYELALIMQEDNLLNQNGVLHLFYAGDFMEREFRKYEIFFDWAMINLKLPVLELFKQSNTRDQADYIRLKVIEQIKQTRWYDDKGEEYINYYPFNSSWITKQKFNWQNNIHIEANRHFDQFITLNDSIDP